MLLKPAEEEQKKLGRPPKEKTEVLPSSEKIDLSASEEVLNTVGLSHDKKGNTGKVEDKDSEEARRIFKEEGATLEEAASAMFRVMRNGESEGAIVSAAKTVATIFGALKDLEGQTVPAINVYVTANKPDKSIINLLMPSR